LPKGPKTFVGEDSGFSDDRLLLDYRLVGRVPSVSPEHRTPVVIKGGMGVAVSDWRLARAVAHLGQLGVVSGTALDVVHARRLGDGDPGGHLRRVYACAARWARR
jgi:NAD(P)H-dependent flavin oxidoreductase YrpB (nitropropane dioxygenase family)